MDITDLAALVFAGITAVVIGFQLALAAGAPWGAYAMGGAFPGRYPPAMRVAAVVMALIVALAALVVLSYARLLLPELTAGTPWVFWVIVALAAVGVVMNAASRSAGERRLWVPVTGVLLVSSLMVAFTA